jgi:CMP-N-acetylneuraminic acid synthetase
MVVLILARGGSKKVPKKNIKLLGDKPTISHVIQEAKKSKLISDIFVSSDCDEILNISEENGAKTIKRPIELSQDLSKDIDSFIHALEKIGDVEEIIQLRATTPLIDYKILDKAINYYNLNKFECTSMRSVHETPDSVLKFYRKKDKFLTSICENIGESQYSELPRQEVPSTFCPNGYIDILKPSTFIDGKSFYGNKILSFETEFTPEIDTIDDFYYIEYLYNKKISKK